MNSREQFANRRTDRGSRPSVPARKRIAAPVVELRDAIDAALVELQDLPEVHDRMVIVKTTSDATTVQMGQRVALVPGLVARGVVSPHEAHLLAHASPPGWGWLLAVLPDATHLVLLSLH